MNKKQVIVLWIVAAALVAALAIVNSSKSDGYQSTTERERGETLLADFKPTEVAAMTITGAEDSVSLKRTDGQWVVSNRDDYPANVSDVNQLLRTIAEVKVTQGIEADPEFAPRFGMDPEAEEADEHGIDLVLSNDAGTELARLSFGKNTEGAANPMSPFGGGGATGRFVRNHADTSGIYVTSELFPMLSAEPSSWLDEDFLRVEKIQSITLSKPGNENTTEWKLTRVDEDGDFEFEGRKDNEELDTAATNPLKNLFSYARFEDLVPADEVEAAWLKPQRQQAVIETFEGFTYNVTFGPEDGSEDYLLNVVVTADIPDERKPAEDETEEQAKDAQEAFETRKKELEEKLEVAKQLEGRTFRVTKFTVDALLKDRTGLIKSAPPADSASPGNAGTPGNGGVPPMLQPTNPTPAPARRPAQAVTPPIAIPPLPEEGDDGEETGDEDQDGNAGDSE
ncbi:DUF4340 domain-containing protein [Haloferula sp. A504]|uniref:DUF4340 domain-containing protein n=1 Tax=Haloferula sp. A504 TaxID=3373601 RepID=UPI0031BE265F|nr:DUF4340 domain-containing protein [Verrucomicrobiaceae bacterium E54]